MPQEVPHFSALSCLSSTMAYVWDALDSVRRYLATTLYHLKCGIVVSAPPSDAYFVAGVFSSKPLDGESNSCYS
jgi:hypothetical protein